MIPLHGLSTTRPPKQLPHQRLQLLQRFRLASLEGLGLGEAPLALRAAGGLLAYLDTNRASIDVVTVEDLERP